MFPETNIIRYGNDSIVFRVSILLTRRSEGEAKWGERPQMAKIFLKKGVSGVQKRV